MKKENKNKVEKTPFMKTKVKPDNSIEVEMKNPSKTLLGRVFIWVIIFGMTLLSLVSLIVLFIQMGK